MVSHRRAQRSHNEARHSCSSRSSCRSSSSRPSGSSSTAGMRSPSGARRRTPPTSPRSPEPGSSPRWIGGDTTDGTDANVKAAITHVHRGEQGRADHVRLRRRADLDYVDDGTGDRRFAYVGNWWRIPTPARSACQRQLQAASWTPFFVGFIVSNWTASATATARAGTRPAGPGGNVFPAGIAEAFFNGRTPCAGAATANVGGPGACDPQHLTPGNLNVPGGFGWLKFGCDGL